jgi:hypothetical protein
VFTPTLSGWDLVDGWLQEQPAPAGIATDQDLDKFQRQMDADRAYGAMLILLGKRKITITEAMDGTHPRHVRPIHRAPPK